MKGHRMHKKRLSAPERHAIEAALKGEPFPGLVYRRGEFSIAGNMLVLPDIGRIPIPGDIPPKGRIGHAPGRRRWLVSHGRGRERWRMRGTAKV
jgi:hypothetical protein